MEPLTILLVDDSKPARYALRLQLQRHGVRVDAVHSAEAALEHIAAAPPDAVLMDDTMPGMNGFQALEILKSDRATAQIPVVMCTSHDDPSFSAQALKRGAMSVLSKATAEDLLPQVLAQIRAAAARPAGATVPPATGQLSRRTPKPAPGAAPTRADIEAWIDDHLRHRLAEAMESHLERLSAELRQAMVAQLETALDARSSSDRGQAVAPGPAPIHQQPPFDLEHLCTNIIPAAVRRQLDTERDQMARLVQQHIEEALARQADDPQLRRSIFQSHDDVVTGPAIQIALSEEHQALVALRRRLGLSLALAAAALVLAMVGAAAHLLPR